MKLFFYFGDHLLSTTWQKKDCSMHSFWGILWGEYTTAETAVESVLPCEQRHSISSSSGNCRALKRTGQYKGFLPSISSENESSPSPSCHSLSSLCRIWQAGHIMMLWDTIKTYHKVDFILILQLITWLIDCSNSTTSVLHGLSYAAAIRGGPWWEKIHKSVLFILLWRSWGFLLSLRKGSDEPVPPLLHGSGWENEGHEHPSQLSHGANAAA